jgi:4-hydroxybenzoate polyprenyltransferase
MKGKVINDVIDVRFDDADSSLQISEIQSGSIDVRTPHVNMAYALYILLLFLFYVSIASHK